jgi:hypothetical protein
MSFKYFFPKKWRFCNLCTKYDHDIDINLKVNRHFLAKKVDWPKPPKTGRHHNTEPIE